MAKKQINYRQCHLKKKTQDGKTYWEQVSWIPEPYCVVGKTLKLKDSEGLWEDGWKVVSAGPPRPDVEVEANSRNYLKQRQASDI